MATPNEVDIALKFGGDAAAYAEKIITLWQSAGQLPMPERYDLLKKVNYLIVILGKRTYLLKRFALHLDFVCSLFPKVGKNLNSISPISGVCSVKSSICSCLLQFWLVVMASSDPGHRVYVSSA